MAAADLVADLKCVVKADATQLLQVFFMAIFAFILGLPMLKSYVAFSAVVSWIVLVWLSSCAACPLGCF